MNAELKINPCEGLSEHLTTATETKKLNSQSRSTCLQVFKILKIVI